MSNKVNKDEIVLNKVYVNSDKNLVILEKLDTDHGHYAYYHGLVMRGRDLPEARKLDTDYIYELNNFQDRIIKAIELSPKRYKLETHTEGKFKLIHIPSGQEAVFKLKNTTYLDVLKASKNLAKNDELREEGKKITNKTFQDKMFEIAKEGIEDIKNVEIHVSGKTIREKYTQITGNLSEVTKNINQDFSLEGHKELADSFASARAEIESLMESGKAKEGLNFIKKWTKESSLMKKLTKDTKDFYIKSKSTQDTIDFIFGSIYKKFDSFVNMGENLQRSKEIMIKQVILLDKLLEESNEALSHYKSRVDIPFSDLSLNTEIKSNIEKYKQRMAKVDGAILATQTTIIALSKNLPSMKTDLTDEMAIGGLLSSVDDYQKMYQEASDLIAKATEATAQKTHDVVEQLLDIQINDKTTLDYLESSSVRAKEFGTMIAEKTKVLSAKIMNDAERMDEIASKPLPDIQKIYKIGK